MERDPGLSLNNPEIMIRTLNRLNHPGARPIDFLIVLVPHIFCAGVAEMLLCFPESPSLHGCGLVWTTAVILPDLWKTHPNQQPSSLFAWKVGAGCVYFSLSVASLISGAPGWHSEQPAGPAADTQQTWNPNLQDLLIRWSKLMRQVQEGFPGKAPPLT